MDIHSSDNPGEPGAVLVTALRRMLRPIVKLLIGRQITYPFLINLLKTIYVEVAEKEFPVEGKKQTDSRISLLTGVHRKDVKRLRAERIETAPVPASISVGAQLVARWLGSREILDCEGTPRPLPLRAQGGPAGPTFDDLVEAIVHQDIRPRVVLDELLRLDVASLDSEGRVRLTTGAFTPDKGLEEKLFFFGKNLQDHICAGVHNLEGRKPPFFDRSVYYDQLSRESLDTLTDMCNKLGMQTLVSVNQKALELQNEDKKREATQENAARYRMNFGIFHYTTEYSPADPADTGDTPPREEQ